MKVIQETSHAHCISYSQTCIKRSPMWQK